VSEGFEQTLRIHLWADARAPGSARRLVRQLDWLAPPAAEVAALVASELVSNAVAHVGAGEADSIGLRLSRATEQLMIEAELEQLGDLEGRLRASRMTVAERDGAHGGLSVAIVDGLADDWGIVDGSGWASLRI